MYKPSPVNLDDVVLTQELDELTEVVAKNVHETWAAQRLAEGWTYGPKYDGEKKKTPWLVPYEELPESEKDYDRNTALSTIKLVTKLGYKISKK